jgi:hypothetical protein
MLAISAIFKKASQSKSLALAENSPNLATLLSTDQQAPGKIELDKTLLNEHCVGRNNLSLPVKNVFGSF